MKWIATLSVSLAFAAAAHEPQPISCADLTTLALPDASIALADALPAGANPAPVGVLPLPICRVVGKIKSTNGEYNINFELWLPATGWNAKFNGVGNGGLAGFINYNAMRNALARGYATASTDTGHISNGPPIFGDWALNRPDLLVDFGYHAVHRTTKVAKTIVRAHYGERPKYSYFTGCSGGGQQGLMEAQRFPEDYDGVVSGAPANYPTRMWPGELWPAIATADRSDAGQQALISKLPAIARAVIAACDAADGVADGVLDDPRQCDFDPAVLWCGGADTPNCLTAPQVDWVKKIYAGLKDPRNGAQYWPGYEVSSELNWAGHIVPFSIPLSYFKYMVYEDPSWDYRTYDLTDRATFEVVREADRQLGPVLDAVDPSLRGFVRRGGKLLMYHGWIDQNIAPRNSINYYERVRQKMGEGSHRKTQEFLRLFMVPGMQHCSGGPGPNTFDALGALEQWVEQGIAPDRIVASHATNGVVDRTRPLCPYPQVAVYGGQGSTDEAANFACRNPRHRGHRHADHDD